MAEPTLVLNAILTGLTRGGQAWLADQIREALAELGPEDVYLAPPETRRQIDIADEVVSSFLRKELGFRKTLLDMGPTLGLKTVDVIETPVDGERADRIDSLLDANSVEALHRFQGEWDAITRRVREQGLKP